MIRTRRPTVGLVALLAVVALAAVRGAAGAAPADRFDIAPFALPNCAPGEYRFEEPRDIATLVVRFRGRAPERIGVRYLRKTWPQVRLETARDVNDPCGFGWMPIDDWFNGDWRAAAVDVRPLDAGTVAIAFKGLTAEFPDAADYDVACRRTLGVKIAVPDPAQIASVRIFTTSPQAASRLGVELDAGRRTPGERVRVAAYNARVMRVMALRGVRVARDVVELLPAAERSFVLDVAHMRSNHAYGNDDGFVTFMLDADTFTVSLPAMEREGLCLGVPGEVRAPGQSPISAISLTTGRVAPAHTSEECPRRTGAHGPCRGNGACPAAERLRHAAWHPRRPRAGAPRTARIGCAAARPCPRATRRSSGSRLSAPAWAFSLSSSHELRLSRPG